MVYLTAEELGWKPYVRTWIDVFFENNTMMDDELKEHLLVTFDATVDVGLQWIRVNGDEPIKTTDLQQVVSLCNFLEAFVDESKGFKAKTIEERKKILDALFAYAFAWGLGGSLTQPTKERFDTVIKDQFKAA